MGFHISRRARDTYGFDNALFESGGKVVFANFTSVQQFAAQLQQTNTNARAGEINAMALMQEVFRYILELYRQEETSAVMDNALHQLQAQLGSSDVDEALREFAGEFPTQSIYHDGLAPDVYLAGETGGNPHRQLLLRELLLLSLINDNPACNPYKNDLFDDSQLKRRSFYPNIIAQLETYFKGQPGFGPDNQDLLTMLKSPARAVPGSLSGQLEYIKEHWGDFLGEFLSRLLSGLDFLKEEEKIGLLGPGETPVPDYSEVVLDDEYESFTEDLHWMPRLILMAKSTHVWLDQLSRSYNRSITTLDQVPDEELDRLASMGITGLWLIGLWQRSDASQRIKQMCGNPEALASAYSIFQYRIADELGGDDALWNLKQRAWKRGIRMASDMVPNHMGLDSPWLVEHPDWFLSLPYCPYPTYSFNGPDLAADSRISIFLEDHYYDRTDAAVVFKWRDNRSGEVRYIYHGNDGTAMPWNDTAQLNYLNPEVREAVMNTILSVAEKFPIIRFDAAMILTKRHYQRLWFPEPGSGGDIPTRVQHGMTRENFVEHMPEEFWRQVVDRFNVTRPDTLLLAEAFWLMETYFVRTLGMHRVYNSAFMNFLKNEDNAQFRASIKNVLLFNPEILKRFVNFLNNPDEETAVAQFGKDDKYFGVCTLMVTLPGLPMFGHGQIEGYSEKYGMEYRRAYRGEVPDPHLMERHENEIFPLVRKRYLFADVKDFLLYDFFTPEGRVDENVIAYSNRFGQERTLVLYNNVYGETAGWIKSSVPFAFRDDKGQEVTVAKDLADGLALNRGETDYTIFRDQVDNLEYIRSSKDLADNGLYVQFQAFKRKVYMDFREVTDNEDGVYAKLDRMLAGHGVPSISETVRRHFYNPLREPFQTLVSPGLLKRVEEAGPSAVCDSLADVKPDLIDFYAAVNQVTGRSGGKEKATAAEVTQQLCLMVERLLTLPALARGTGRPLEQAAAELEVKPYLRAFSLAWIYILQIEEFFPESDSPGVWPLLEDWLLTSDILDLLTAWGASDHEAARLLKTLKILTIYRPWWTSWTTWRLVDRDDHRKWLDRFFQDPDVNELLNVNRHNNILWFGKEAVEELTARMLGLAMLGLPGELPGDPLAKLKRMARYMNKLIHRSGYQVDKLKR